MVRPIRIDCDSAGARAADHKEGTKYGSKEESEEGEEGKKGRP